MIRAVFLQEAIVAGPFILVALVILLAILGLIVFLVVALGKPGSHRLTISIMLAGAITVFVLLLRWLNALRFD